MLCDRPTFAPSEVFTFDRNHVNNGKVTVANEGSKDRGSGANGNSFLCGTVSKPWGTNVKIPEKSRVLSSLSKTDGALSRHKAWLREMQEKRDQEIKRAQDEKSSKECKRKEFMERQARLRAQIRSEKDREKRISFEEDGDDQSLSSVNVAGEKRCRPAWSLTESDAHNMREESEAREEEELMNYVDNLDFETYYDDMELSVLMSQVKERIRTLEKEKKIDDVKLKTTIEVRSSVVTYYFQKLDEITIKYLALHI